MNAKTKLRVVMISTLIFCLTLPLVRSCDAQCVCLPLPPLPLPWWCCQRTTCQPAKPQQPKACEAPKAKPNVTSCACGEGLCPKCPACPKCGTCHDQDYLLKQVEESAKKLGEEDSPLMEIDPALFPNGEHAEEIKPTEIGKDAGKEQVIPAEEPEDMPLVEDIELALEGTDAEVVECFKCLNELRRRSGLPLVKMDEALCRLAQQHSNRMASFRSMFHSGCGYAENVAFGNTSGQRTFNQWHRSPGHLQNMLRGGSKVGIARCGIYWTFVIGR